MASKIKWTGSMPGVRTATWGDISLTVEREDGAWFAQVAQVGVDGFWRTGPFDTDDAAKQAAEQEALAIRARPHLKRFTVDGDPGKGAARDALKAAGWINYQHGMWGLTAAGRTEAERLGHL